MWKGEQKSFKDRKIIKTMAKDLALLPFTVMKK